MNLLSMGLATSQAFRRKFMALNCVLDKRADIGEPTSSGKTSARYRPRIGAKVKRFAVPWAFPVDYRLLL